MIPFEEKDLNLLQQICRAKQLKLKDILTDFLKKHYNKVISTNFYTFAEGDIPVALVAHLDTVFQKTPSEIYFDSKKNVMWSPQGLGADDRAGVFGIIQIILRGYKPHIIFTTGEEFGGVGATRLKNDYPIQPFNKLKYMIELDRCGFEDCVFYDCDNPTFTEYVSSCGFEEDFGTFSDISILAPQWNIAAVNLSIGYVREHSTSETLFLSATRKTIDKVCVMLSEANDEEVQEFIYIPLEINIPITYPYQYHKGLEHCWYCGEENKPDDMFPVKRGNNITDYFCIDCAANPKLVKWCSKCGEPFFDYCSNEDLCYDCRNNKE